jgi:hypothetical protein
MLTDLEVCQVVERSLGEGDHLRNVLPAEDFMSPQNSTVTTESDYEFNFIFAGISEGVFEIA